MPNCAQLRRIPDHSAHSSTRRRRSLCSTANSYAHLRDRGLGLKILVSILGHSSAFLSTPAHSSAHVFVED